MSGFSARPRGRHRKPSHGGRRCATLAMLPALTGAAVMTGGAAATAAPLGAAPPVALSAAAPPAAAPTLTRAPGPVLRYGSRGTAVKSIQRRLGVTPVSGWYGPRTTAAVKRFQRRHHLPVTGAVDAKTWRALRGGAASPAARTPAPTRSASYDLGRVRPHVAAAARDLGPRFGITRIGGHRAGRSGDHPSGLALDFMTRGANGDRLAAYARANAARYRVSYVIWDRRIWNVARASEGWRRYNGPNPHTDHVHVSFKP